MSAPRRVALERCEITRCVGNAMTETSTVVARAGRRRGDAGAGRPARAGPVRPGHRLDIHRPDHRAAAGDQHLSADLDHLSLASPTTGRTGPMPAVKWVGVEQLSNACWPIRRYLAGDAGHRAFRVLDHRRSRPCSAWAWPFSSTSKFRGHGFWTTIILLPMMLSPAVVGVFLDVPVPAADRAVQLHRRLSSPARDPSSFQMLGDVTLAPWAIVIVDAWMWTPYVMLICLAGLRVDPGIHL